MLETHHKLSATIFYWVCAFAYFSISPVHSQIKEVGDISNFEKQERTYFEGSLDFQKMPKPEPGDWLSNHVEKGQSFGKYVIENHPKPDSDEIITIQPIGSFGNMESLMPIIDEYTEVFFGRKTILLDSIQPQYSMMNYRSNPFDGHLQAKTDGMLKVVYSTKPESSFLSLGVCLIDLYPDDDWNFVYGLAIPNHRIGIFSLARYVEKQSNESSPEPHTSNTLLIRRSLKVMTHEMAHLFGLNHCIYYKCLLNGSNHLNEMDNTPLHLCPVCLHKLQHACRFNLTDRYIQLEKFYEKHGLGKESSWVHNRLFPLDEHIIE